MNQVSFSLKTDATRGLLHTAVPIRGTPVVPAGTALRGGGVSRESRVHPSRTCSTGRNTSIGRGPFANCDVSRSTPEAAVHPASGLTMIRQGVPSPHMLVSSRAKNPIRS